jgi:hypothetical protein
MAKGSVIIDYGRDPDNELDNYAQSVYNALFSNPNFVWGEGVLASFLTNINDYANKLEIAKNGSTLDTAIKNAAKLVLTDQMRVLATEVNRQANGDILKLQSSGFTLAKERAKTGILPKPTGFKVKSGTNSGDILCDVDANTDADMYFFYSAPVPAPANINDWRLTPSTTRKKNISGYTPGKQYEFKCAYKGSDDALAFSDSIFLYAQ